MLVFVLRLLHDDGETREYVTYRDADLPDMSRIGELNELVCEMIYDCIEEVKQMQSDEFYETVIIDENDYGAVISVDGDTFAAIAEDFNVLARACRSVLLYKMMAGYN